MKLKKKNGFRTPNLPQSDENLYPQPNYNHFSGHITKASLPVRQEPKLQHELSTEDTNLDSGGGLKLSMLYDTQHPLNALPPALKKRIDLMMKMMQTTPSMTNYSNMDAPTPMNAHGETSI